MPLYLVTHHCPNGNTISRVVCNISAAAAFDEREAELGIHDARAEGFEAEVQALADPDGGRDAEGNGDEFCPDPEISDAVLSCPDCDRPNQFGQVCDSCEQNRQDEIDEACR
jgi:hypothetical protein